MTPSIPSELDIQIAPPLHNCVELEVQPGDLLVVDRSQTAQDGSLVVAAIAGSLQVLRVQKQRDKLVPAIGWQPGETNASSTYGTITVLPSLEETAPLLSSNLGGPLLWAAIVTKRPELTTQRLILRLGSTDDIPAILHYYRVNQAYLEPFEPQRPDSFYTRDFWKNVLASRISDFHTGYAVKLLMFLQAEPDQVIGTINLNTIVRGALHGATLGYSLSAQHQGNGYMTEAGQRLIAYAFDDLNLHRIMANYMPHNHRSANVLKRLGFEVEGMAKDYLFINGQWQDHVMASLVNPHWQMPES